MTKGKNRDDMFIPGEAALWMETLLLCNARHYASLEGQGEDEDAKYAHPLKWKPEHQADAYRDESIL